MHRIDDITAPVEGLTCYTATHMLHGLYPAPAIDHAVKAVADDPDGTMSGANILRVYDELRHQADLATDATRSALGGHRTVPFATPDGVEWELRIGYGTISVHHPKVRREAMEQDVDFDPLAPLAPGADDAVARIDFDGTTA